MFSTGFTSLNLLLFFLYWSPSLSLCTVFDSVSSKIDEILLINTSTNMFVFGDFNVHHKDWLTHSGGTDRHGQLCYNDSVRLCYLKWPYSDGYLSYLETWLWLSQPSSSFGFISFLLLVFVLQWRSLHWKILFMLLSQFPLIFCQTQNGMPHLTA